MPGRAKSANALSAESLSAFFFLFHRVFPWYHHGSLALHESHFHRALSKMHLLFFGGLCF